MASAIIKTLGFIYYTVTTTTLMIFINFYLRLHRRPSSQFYITTKTISKGLTTFYSLVNLFVFYYFFSNKIYGHAFYLLNEFITIAFSYFILAGFHVYGITGQICSGKTSACEYLKRNYKATIISLDEINNDFLFYERNLEEEECHNELWNILNNSSEKNFSVSDYQNVPKIKRCKNKIEQTQIDFLKECDIDELFNEFNSMMTQQNE